MGSVVWTPSNDRSVPEDDHPERRLATLGLSLPAARRPVGSYVMAVTEGSLVFVAGHAAFVDGQYVTGTVGDDLNVDSAREAARLSALNCLASLKAEIGDLDRVRRIVRVFGMVRCTPEFTEHPAVMDGCSDLLLAAFGNRGRHTRAAVGMNSLPFGTAVETEMVVAL